VDFLLKIASVDALRAADLAGVHDDLTVFANIHARDLAPSIPDALHCCCNIPLPEFGRTASHITQF
jgi:hypothetical protein